MPSISPRRMCAAALAALSTLLVFSGCSSNSPIGTYAGSSGHTGIRLLKDHKCEYDDHWTRTGVSAESFEAEETCTWTLDSGGAFTFTRPEESNTIYGTLKDKTITLPDQPHWNGEVYTKVDS